MATTTEIQLDLCLSASLLPFLLTICTLLHLYLTLQQPAGAVSDWAVSFSSALQAKRKTPSDSGFVGWVNDCKHCRTCASIHTHTHTHAHTPIHVHLYRRWSELMGTIIVRDICQVGHSGSISPRCVFKKTQQNLRNRSI